MISVIAGWAPSPWDPLVINGFTGGNLLKWEGNWRILRGLRILWGGFFFQRQFYGVGGGLGGGGGRFLGGSGGIICWLGLFLGVGSFSLGFWSFVVCEVGFGWWFVLGRGGGVWWVVFWGVGFFWLCFGCCLVGFFVCFVGVVFCFFWGWFFFLFGSFCFVYCVGFCFPPLIKTQHKPTIVCGESSPPSWTPKNQFFPNPNLRYYLPFCSPPPAPTQGVLNSKKLNVFNNIGPSHFIYLFFLA